MIIVYVLDNIYEVFIIRAIDNVILEMQLGHSEQLSVGQGSLSAVYV